MDQQAPPSRPRTAGSDEDLPEGLEARIRYYEQPGNDAGRLGRAEWTILGLTGVALPLVCLLLGWVVGWPA